MANDAKVEAPDDVFYPESDGQPMAETPTHRQDLTDLIAMLQAHFLDDPMVYVSGNLFLYYERGNRYRCLAPDVFLVHGVDKNRRRGVYKTWEEGQTPDLVIELTSPSTRDEDLEHKFTLYQDTLRVREYFLFDPLNEYLQPPLQGYRRMAEHYEPIEPVNGRLPSEVVGLHFERNDDQLRLFHPATGRWLPTPWEAQVEAEASRDQAFARLDRAVAERAREAAGHARAVAERDQAIAERDQATSRLSRAATELETPRRELEALKRTASGGLDDVGR